MRATFTTMVVLAVSLAAALQSAPQTTPPQTTPPPATPAPRPAQPARPGSLSLIVFSENGGTLSGTLVSLRGNVDRGGTSGADGSVVLQNIPAGTYRVRLTRDGFITFEKEVTIRSGARTTTEAVLSAAPAAPAPPPPPPAPTPTPSPVTTPGAAGLPKVLSIPDLFQQMSRDAQPIVEREIGCSGITSSRVILARQPIVSHSHIDLDEVFYIVAGEATFRVGDREENVGAGWYGLAPRGVIHSLTPRGRNAPFILSVRTGKACE